MKNLIKLSTLIMLVILAANVNGTELIPGEGNIASTAADAELPVSLEGWMTTPATWTNEKGTEDQKLVTTESNDSVIEFNTQLQNDESEDKLKLEDWMLNVDDDFWAFSNETDIPLEAWMSDPESWKK